MVSQNKRPADETATVTQRSWRRKIYDGAAAVDRFIETNPFIRLFGLAGALFGFVVLILTALQVREDVASRQEEERVARAWDTLYRPALGNTGKGQAINTLFRSGATLDAVDISCGTMQGRSAEMSYCDMPPVISDLDLTPDNRGGEMFTLMGWKLNGATIANSVIKSATITGVKMNEATVMDSTFDSVELAGELRNASFLNVEFTNSQIRIDCRTEALTGNISGSILTNERGCVPADLNAASQIWAWANNPPAFIRGQSTVVKPFTNFWYCDPRKPKPTTARNDKWGDSCERMTEDQARKAFPAEWQRKFSSSN